MMKGSAKTQAKYAQRSCAIVNKKLYITTMILLIIFAHFNVLDIILIAHAIQQIKKCQERVVFKSF